MLDRILRFLCREKEKPEVKYCGGVRTRHGHHEPRRWMTPAEGESKMVTRSPSHIKPKKTMVSKVIPTKKTANSNKRNILMGKWKPMIDRLKSDGTVHVNRNVYYGNLRGNDILISAKRELRRLGYIIEIRMRGHDGSITLKGREKAG